MLNSLIPYLSWVALAFIILFAISASISVLHFRRVRRAPYYVMREEARRKGLSWLTGGLASLALGMVLLYLKAHPSAIPIPTATAPPPSPPPTHTPTIPPSPTSLPLPTALPSPTPTRPATATPPFIPTPTPLYPLPDTALTPQPDSVPAGPDAEIAILTFALEEENGEPVEPGSEFPPGDRRVYLFFEYRGMDRGVIWTYGWYQEGAYVDGNTCPWGIAKEGCPLIFGRTGTNYLYYRLPGGYEPGVYDARIWIEGRLQDSRQFIISETP